MPKSKYYDYTNKQPLNLETDGCDLKDWNRLYVDYQFAKDPKGSKIYFGGPVGLNIGCVLHESTYKTDKTLNISKELSLTSDKKIIKDIRKNNGPDNFMFALGYAGWDRGQLISEIENGDWLVAPSSSECIFKIGNNEKWDLYSSLIGFNLDELSGETGKA